MVGLRVIYSWDDIEAFRQELAFQVSVNPTNSMATVQKLVLGRSEFDNANSWVPSALVECAPYLSHVQHITLSGFRWGKKELAHDSISSLSGFYGSLTSLRIRRGLLRDTFHVDELVGTFPALLDLHLEDVMFEISKTKNVVTSPHLTRPRLASLTVDCSAYTLTTIYQWLISAGTHDRIFCKV